MKLSELQSNLLVKPHPHLWRYGKDWLGVTIGIEGKYATVSWLTTRKIEKVYYSHLQNLGYAIECDRSAAVEIYRECQQTLAARQERLESHSAYRQKRQYIENGISKLEALSRRQP